MATKNKNNIAYENACCFVVVVVVLLGFTPCKTEQPMQGMELQEKEAQND